MGGRREAVLIGPLLALAIAVAACSQAAGPQGTPNAADSTATPTLRPGSPTASVAQTPLVTQAPTTGPSIAAPTASPASQPTTPPTERPLAYPWLATELRDVRTGEIVRPADLLGKVLVIEPMAVWCSNCRAQQNEARTALANLGSSDIVYVSLDVDPFETEADLAQYADDRGYPWHFSIASDDLARELAAAFGPLALSPPATPKIVVAPDGTVKVSFGHKSAEKLEAELGALLP
jgi:hypothetical protein